MPNEITGEQLEKLLKLAGSKRAKIVVKHIAKYGQITTEELQQTYGYDHPPRAAKDVRDCGIPLDTHRVLSERSGRRIAAYRFGDLSQLRISRAGGRRVFSKSFKQCLLKQYGAQCAICGIALPGRYLQIDHRVPYEISGDDPDSDLTVEPYMLLCRSCNRAKSWSCEHCKNWLENPLPETCLQCYWSNPDSYKHIALMPVRRLDLVWLNNEVWWYDLISRLAREAGVALPEFVKEALKQHFGDD
jgi:5-methylcytosine-specific restriction endonuclease McrA